jgi:ribonuclease HII
MMGLQSYYKEGLLEAGCDEAGRGCLAGPVFAAAVILPPTLSIPELNDSKKLSAPQRASVRLLIEEKALAWAVASVSPIEIDEINILNASYLAMHRAIKKLQLRPEFLLIDGNRFKPYIDIPHACIVKGDGKFASIAAASVLAKTYRDEEMTKLSTIYPEYAWQQNKGYPTKTHRKAIAKCGITQHHRKSFKILPEGEQISLFPKF